MVNYQLGKIYKLISPSGLIYVGSTCETLSKRLGGHKRDYKYYQKHKNRNKVTSFILFDEDIDNIDIVLIENYPCNSKDELHARERYYIDSLKCVNITKPHRTHKEWLEDNKDNLKEKNKEWGKKWREENKEYKSEIDKNWREKNKEYKAQRDKEYYEKNKELILSKLREKRKKIKEDDVTL